LITLTRGGNASDIFYGVLDSSGALVTSLTNLSNDGAVVDEDRSDSVQLPGGRIVVVWGGNGHIRYALLDAAYALVAGPTFVAAPADDGNDAVSVTSDGAGNAVLTWRNQRGLPALYYALLSPSGSLRTPPMILRRATGGPDFAYIDVSDAGFGNALWWMSPAGPDTAISFSAPVYGGIAGGHADAALSYANHSATTARNVAITLTISANLTYAGDTSGITPAISGRKVTWSVPNLSFLETRSFTVSLNQNSYDYGKRLPLSAQIGSSGVEANPAGNVAQAGVMVAHGTVYLLPAMADTMLSVSAPDANAGMAKTAACGGFGTQKNGQPCLFKFDLSAIAGITTVDGAQVQFYGNSQVGAGSVTYAAYALLSPWTETGATWNKYAPGLSWAIPGAQSTTADREGAASGTVTATATTPGWTIINMGSLAQRWVSGSLVNNGIKLQKTGGTATGILFTMRHTAANPPLLVIDSTH
jgi:hypothetical protein